MSRAYIVLYLFAPNPIKKPAHLLSSKNFHQYYTVASACLSPTCIWPGIPTTWHMKRFVNWIMPPAETAGSGALRPESAQQHPQRRRGVGHWDLSQLSNTRRDGGEWGTETSVNSQQVEKRHFLVIGFDTQEFNPHCIHYVYYKYIVVCTLVLSKY